VSDVPRQEESVAPEVNICETSDGYVLEAEMPGVSKDGLEISVEGTEIVINAILRYRYSTNVCCHSLEKSVRAWP
jgi:HSP20 family molecular chaperone IbpA